MDHGGVSLMGSGLSLLGAEDSRSRFSCIASAPPRNSTPLAGDELFGNSLGGSVGASLFNLFPSGQSRDVHTLSAITDSRDCNSLLNSSNSRSDSNSDVQILPPTAGQVEASEHDMTGTSLLPADSASQPAAGTKTPVVISSRKKTSERIAAHGEAKDSGRDGGGKTSRNSPDNERRLQGTWTADENVKFFNALRAHARSFDKIHDEMGTTKTREQVRCYYYRVIKKINQIIAYTGTKIDKGSNSEGNGVIEAILCWWDLMRKGTTEDTSVNLFRNSANLSDEERIAFAERLWSKSATKSNGKHPQESSKSDTKSSVAQRIEFDGPAGRASAARKDDAGAKGAEKAEVKPEARAHAAVEHTPKREAPSKSKHAAYLSPPTGKLAGETPLRDERVLIQSPKGHSLSDGSLHDSPNGTSPLSFQISGDGETGADSADRLKLRLLARNPELGGLIKRCGYNPQLELTFKPTKAIGSIAARLSEKWGAKLQELLSERGGVGKAGGWGVGAGGERRDVVFRLFMAKEDEQDAHPGWGPDDRTVQARQVHSFMGNPSRFNLFYSLDEREPSPQHGSQRDLEEDVVDQHASGLRQGKSIGSLDQDSSSSSNDFVPFQRHLARLDAFQGPASSPQRDRGDRSDYKASPARHPPGGIDFAKVAPKISASGVPWTEDDVLFSSMLASRDGMGYTHSNMGSLTFPGDSLDGLSVLLNPDDSSLGAALGAGLSSRPATSSAAPAVAETAPAVAETAPANPVTESEDAAKTVFNAEAVSKEEPAEAMKVDAGAEAKDAAPKAAGEKRTATEAETEGAAESTPKRVKQSLNLIAAPTSKAVEAE